MMIRGHTILLVCCTSLACASIASSAERLDDRPELQVSVSISREALSANDSVPVHIWLANQSPTALTAVRMRFDGPAFVGLHEADCQDKLATGSLSMGRLAANTVAYRTLCLRTGSVVQEGDFNITFSFEYEWSPAGASVAHAHLLIEKRIQVGVLGSENIGGISLRLAAYIVPGLLAFALLRLAAGLPASTLTATDTAVLSIVYSVVLVSLANWISPSVIGRGMSPTRFLVLCVGGAVTAAVFLLVRGTTKRRREWPLVGPNDTGAVALEKLLKLRRRGEWDPVTVQLKDGTSLVGSLAGKTRDGGTAVLGWFEAAGGSDDLRRTLTDLARQGKLAKAATLMRKRHLEPTMRDGIKRQKEGVTQSTYQVIMRLDAIEVTSTTVGPVSDVQGWMPLTI